MIRAGVSRGFTFVCTRISGETVRPRHDLSHPARTKKQIDASSHYNSLPPRPSLHRAMLYPPGIARQIKHHLLSERVDLTAPSAASRRGRGGRTRRRSGTIFRSQRARRGASILRRISLLQDDEYGRVAIQREEKICHGRRTPGVLGLRVRA